MSSRPKPRSDTDPVDPAVITHEQARQAARVVAGHATDPEDARELLDMLGLRWAYLKELPVDLDTLAQTDDEDRLS